MVPRLLSEGAVGAKLFVHTAGHRWVVGDFQSVLGHSGMGYSQAEDQEFLVSNLASL